MVNYKKIVNKKMIQRLTANLKREQDRTLAELGVQAALKRENMELRDKVKKMEAHEKELVTHRQALPELAANVPRFRMRSRLHSHSPNVSRRPPLSLQPCPCFHKRWQLRSC